MQQREIKITVKKTTELQQYNLNIITSMELQNQRLKNHNNKRDHIIATKVTRKYEYDLNITTSVSKYEIRDHEIETTKDNNHNKKMQNYEYDRNITTSILKYEITIK